MDSIQRFGCGVSRVEAIREIRGWFGSGTDRGRSSRRAPRTGKSAVTRACPFGKFVRMNVRRFLSGLCLLGVIVLQTSPLAGAEVPQMEGRVPVTPPTGVDVAFDIRAERLPWSKDHSEAFLFVEKEFTRDPRPHVKARYADFLVQGSLWGAPDNSGDYGIRLAEEALAAGSMHALSVLGWEYLRRRMPTDDVGRGLGYLQQGASEGHVGAMLLLGDAYFRGVGIPKSAIAAEIWLTRAARFGKPHSLFRLAKAYEDGAVTGQPDLANACRLYYEANINGARSARERLAELAGKGDVHALRAQRLVLLWDSARGADIVTPRLKEAIRTLEEKYPDDPQVLVAIGSAYWNPELGNPDYKKAFAYFDRAAKAGSAEGRALRARLMVEGYGTKKDVSAGLAEWRALEEMNNPEAIGQLGYFYYWGPVGAAGLTKDPEKALSYSKRAADFGEYSGQMNTATCYEFGIGVSKDYALAAYYYQMVAAKGSVRGRDKVRRLLPHIK
jgi:TPR repeat protein